MVCLLYLCIIEHPVNMSAMWRHNYQHEPSENSHMTSSSSTHTCFYGDSMIVCGDVTYGHREPHARHCRTSFSLSSWQLSSSAFSITWYGKTWHLDTMTCMTSDVIFTLWLWNHSLPTVVQGRVEHSGDVKHDHGYIFRWSSIMLSVAKTIVILFVVLKHARQRLHSID